MNSRALERIRRNADDLLFIGIIVLCLVLSIGGIVSELERREALLKQVGGRKIDISEVRKQISDGTLSPRKALFYKKVPR